jgi:hypothetical protein
MDIHPLGTLSKAMARAPCPVGMVDHLRLNNSKADRTAEITEIKLWIKTILDIALTRGVMEVCKTART